MARPPKAGLDYFPLDVDIDQNDKIAIIEASHGLEGFAIAIKLFMKIYDNGYFYEWGEKEQLLFSRRVNVDINRVNVIINDCIKWGIFSEDIYKQRQTLTSRGIQRRYLEATTRRKQVEINRGMLLLKPEEVNAYKNLVIVDINTRSKELMLEENTQSKVKESKVKESKVNHLPNMEDIPNEEEPIEETEEPKNGGGVFEFFQDHFGVISATTADNLNQWIEDLGEPLVLEAYKFAIEDKAEYPKAYAESIMRRWLREGIQNLEQAKQAEEEHKNAAHRGSNGGHHGKSTGPGGTGAPKFDPTGPPSHYFE